MSALDGKDMTNFDWVTALFSCRPHKLFERLMAEAKDDVKARSHFKTLYNALKLG